MTDEPQRRVLETIAQAEAVVERMAEVIRASEAILVKSRDLVAAVNRLLESTARPLVRGPS